MRPWWCAAGVAAGTAYLWVADPTTGSRAFLPCPLKALTGLDCPGCGATRASWALVHGQPVRAVGYNALWCVLAALLAWAWVLDVRGRWGRAWHPFVWRWFAPVTGVTALVFAVARNLPWAPLRALHS